ncbi:MAG: ABC transporter substrate-binding protein [Lachnospiraceae bacterium]|nr:ABC transporter substrate-binding protein [Lachnospiraceae bacterium]
MKKTMKVTGTVLAAMMAMSMTAAAGDTWKIGEIGPTTGAAADYGNNVMNGCQIAVDEINAAGGINGTPIEFMPEDDVHDVEKSSNAYNALVGEGVQAIIGCVTSGPCTAVSSLAAEDNMFMLTPSASSTAVLDAGNADGSQNLFQLCFTDPNQGLASADYIDTTMPEITKVGVIYNNGDVYSTGIFGTFRAQAEQCGFEIVASPAFDDTTVDYSAAIQECMDNGAELVFLPIYYTPASGIFKQANEMGYDPIWFGVDGMDGILTVEGFDTSLAEGVMLLTPFAADAADEKTQNFVKAYAENYGGAVPTQFAADGYDCVYAIKAAIEAAGATPDMDHSAVCDAISVSITEMEPLEGLTGTMTWSADGTVNKTPTAVIIKDGEYVSYEG